MLISRILALAALCIPLWAASPFSADRYLAHVKYLASDALQGRATGSRGLDKAERYIEKAFREAGLQPAGTRGYRQPFTVTTRTSLAPGNTIRFAGQAVKSTDFIPLDMTSSRQVRAPVAYVHYGITAPEYHYDDYAQLNVTGKVVVILRYEPQEFDDHSIFQGRSYTRHAGIDAKVTNAKLHGAVAVIIAADRPIGPSDGDKLATLDGNAAPHEAGIPVMQVRVAVVKEWIKSEGRDLEAMVRETDKSLTNQSFTFGAQHDLEVHANVKRTTSEVHNVLGYVPGETEEYVVVGAHYDHIGLGGRYSMSPSEAGHIHHGADDNASGTAALIELARQVAKEPKRRRGVLFIAFASEELGLLGSAWWVENPTRPLAACDAMLNLDMVGRLRGEHLYLGGGASAKQFPDLIEQLRPSTPILLDAASDSTSAGSDHSSFLNKGIPALFFFTGLHGDYHRPSDTWDKINAAGAVQVLELLDQTLGRLAVDPERAEFVSSPVASQPVGTSSSGGYGPSFGCLPDMSDTLLKGVRCLEFRQGSPAARAGLQAGDILVEFDGRPVLNLQDFTYLLQGKKPGDAVSVGVVRQGQSVQATVTLVPRP